MRANILEQQLMARGWSFVPTGPNEWEWMKFDGEGRPLGRQGDIEWLQDLHAVTGRRPPVRWHDATIPT